MSLKGIISIAGKPGLYKIITQGKSAVIVESLLDKKRSPAYAADKMSAIEDISIFTHEGEVNLTEVFATLYNTSEGKSTINHKVDEKELRSHFEAILPTYDIDRVYLSDIRKVFQWYNLLIKEGLLSVEKEETTEAKKEGKKTKAADAPKKATKTVSSKEPKAVKPNVTKKAPIVKTGAARGK
ncbi:MAG: DUF5606 domain-containing protein [Flavobacteriales bacterium]